VVVALRLFAHAQSFGGDPINRETMLEAKAFSTGRKDAQAVVPELVHRRYAPATRPTTRASAGSHRCGTPAVGREAVTEQYGDDALFLPPPDLGNGPVIGAGSWQMGVTTNCSAEATPGAFEFVLSTVQPENIAMMSEATSLIPTSLAAADLTEGYAEGGPYRIFFDFAQAFAKVRPETPGYLTISSQFEQAGLSIRDGGNVRTPDDAVDNIEQDIADNDGLASAITASSLLSYPRGGLSNLRTNSGQC
jgi:multiple sugar transport system substrate-binding protein